MNEPGRIMALDVGDRRTGIAVTDPGRTIVSPHSVVEEKSRQKAIDAIVRAISSLEPTLIVAGLPLNTDGTDSTQSTRIRTFVALLAAQIQVPIVYQDESYTTQDAESVLIGANYSRQKRKFLVDKLAAANILQGWLDGQQKIQESQQQQ